VRESCGEQSLAQRKLGRISLVACMLLRRLRRTRIPMRGTGCGTGYRINEGPRCGELGAFKTKILWHRGSEVNPNYASHGPLTRREGSTVKN
jgi:hypothetical protein